jgi:hypothetical protein
VGGRYENEKLMAYFRKLEPEKYQLQSSVSSIPNFFSPGTCKELISLLVIHILQVNGVSFS